MTGTPYTQTNTCGSVVPAYSSCSITFTFTPTEDATQNSTSTIYDNATTSPQTYYLYGTGVPANKSVKAQPANQEGSHARPTSDDDDDD